MVQAADFPSITEAAVLSLNLRELLSYRQKQMEAETFGGGYKGKKGRRAQGKTKTPKILCTKAPGLSEGVLAIEEDAALMSANYRKHSFSLFKGRDVSMTVLRTS